MQLWNLLNDISHNLTTSGDWMGYDSHIIKMDNDYYDQDGIMPDIIHMFVIETGSIKVIQEWTQKVKTETR